MTHSSLHAPIDALLLDRYVSGHCAPAERATAEQWLARSPEHAAVAQALREYRPHWEVQPAQTVERGWAVIAARIRGDQENGHMITGCYGPDLALQAIRLDGAPRGGKHARIGMFVHVVRTLVSEVTSRALTLIQGTGTEVPEREFERLRDLVARAGSEDE